MSSYQRINHSGVLSEVFDDLIAAAASKYLVPIPWIQAWIQTESSFNPQAYRAEPQIQDASYGLMQLLYRTAQGLGYDGEPAGLFDPSVNIDLGTKLIAQLRAAYGDDVQRVYSAYNSGKPDAYLTSSQVAANVNRLLGNLERFVSNNPVIASTGVLAPVLVMLMLLFWKQRKKGLL